VVGVARLAASTTEGDQRRCPLWFELGRSLPRPPDDLDHREAIRRVRLGERRLAELAIQHGTEASVLAHDLRS
jgi:hypothetical protein